jgi:thiazolinyl imide reductase
MTKLKRILLCGSNYAKSYLPVIYEAPELFELVGILAQGSRRSALQASQAGVELYSRTADLPEDLVCDMAIVAIGGSSGATIALELLAKKIPVLIEHPVGVSAIRDLLAQSKEALTPMHINSHFSLLPLTQEFIQQSRALNLQCPPTLIHVVCNSRTLFSMMDILGRIFGLFDCARANILPLDNSGHFYSANFSLDGITCQLTYQAWRHGVDDSNDSPLGHQLNLVYPSGTLTLGGTYGPFYWAPVISAEQNKSISTFRVANHWVEVVRWREDANYRAMMDLLENNPDESSKYQTFEYLQNLCRNWSSLFEKMPIVIAL